MLYKYASFDTAEHYIIGKRTLKFTNPLDFNDPFDCNEELLRINIASHHIDHYAKESTKDHSRRVRREMVRTAKKRYNPQVVLKEEKKAFKICCFSTRPDHTLMWSHYGDMHKGICTGFQLPAMDENYALYPVHYINQIEKLDGMTNTSAIFHYWLTRKSACWSYENEIRAIGRNLPDKINFDPEMLREIVFGCKVTDGSISALIKRVKKEFRWIGFKRMQIDRRTFDLKPIDL